MSWVKILIFKKGMLLGTYTGYNSASMATGLTASRICQLIESGKESKSGYSFDREL